MFKYYLVIVLIINIMLGCRGVDNQKIGYLVTPIKNDIYYKCGNIEANLDKDGKFKCNSFPIAFYIDGNEMGTISTIHNDRYVFPQDMEKIVVASK